MAVHSRPSPAPALSHLSQTARERVRRWWLRLSPTHQYRIAALGPLITIALFVLVVFVSIGYLRFEEARRERAALARDLHLGLLQLSERMAENKEQVARLARDVGRGLIDSAGFIAQAEALVTTAPEIEALVWMDGDMRGQAAYVGNATSLLPWSRGSSMRTHPVASVLFAQVHQQRQALYSGPYGLEEQRGLIQLQVPLGVGQSGTTNAGRRMGGVVMAEISLDFLLAHSLSSELLKKYAIALVDRDKRVWAGSLSASGSAEPTPQMLSWLYGLLGISSRQQMLIDFALQEPHSTRDGQHAPLQLVLRHYTSSKGFTSLALRLLVVLLSTLTIWMLWANWQHARRRQRAQQELQAEINFRRAMERSMPTGMRAMDMQGRITYVNEAFCSMTGWSESELVGATAPYVYWPHEDITRLSEVLKNELSGRNTPLGTEMRVLRKDGSQFDARMYVSPLIDAQGKQTGFMTSMTDITEPRRIRNELTNAFERFTTILEGMDASICVSTLGSKQLVFANKVYRSWFGERSQTQPDFVDTLLMEEIPQSIEYGDDVDVLAGLPTSDVEDTPSANREIYVPQLQRWLEVRIRYLNWVDGHLAQMVIANDITQRREAEVQAQEQFEKAQAASRLITMGEMASSVAHELNQPLAAIVNYCSGIKARLQQLDTLDSPTREIKQAVDKTQQQAQRAGQIIHRIRNYVKRSEPNRVPSEVAYMVSEAIELAGIEVRRRRVQLKQHIAARLPLLNVDPILIEQVLVNLIKNAAEAIDQANRPSTLRSITLRVLPKRVDNDEGVEFMIEDTGPGIDPQHLEKIFDAFYTTKLEGMGMGLNLCRAIVESHKGRLSVQNLYNGPSSVVGSAFTFWLPLMPLGRAQ